MGDRLGKKTKVSKHGLNNRTAGDTEFTQTMNLVSDQ